MIEGGTPGGSALAQAAQRRETAERLVTEATWLEAVAADERAMATQLAQLPATHSIFHDLRVPGSKGNIDHLVVGPGGAFLVVTRRVDAAMDFRDGQLWSGAVSLRGDLDAARLEAQLLTQSLGTAVVPVIAYLGSIVPPSAPPALEGVLVCSAENVARVIARGSHTDLAPAAAKDVGTRVLPLLNHAVTAPRTETSGAPSAAPAPRQDPARAARAADVAPSAGLATGPTTGRVKGRARPERSGSHRSVRFVVAAIASLCLVAFAAGSLVRVLWSEDKGSAATPASTDPLAGAVTTIDPASITSLTTALVPTTAAGQAATVAAPAVNVLPVCPATGAGWQLVPAWPGDLAGLARYDLELLGADGQWALVGSFTTSDTTKTTVDGVAANTTVTLRIVAVMADGSRSLANPTPVITPATSC